MTTTIEDTNDLSDIKIQFYAIMENYPAVYANHKANPTLPSAIIDHDKLESKLTTLYRRMFALQGKIEAEMDQHETDMDDLTNASVKLNAMLAKRRANLDGKRAMLEPIGGTLRESFTVGDPTPTTTPSPNQISMVAEARDIEKSAYTYSIARVVYLVVGIVMVSYFILQTVGRSTLLEDAKLKAEQLKNKLYTQTIAQPAQPDAKS